MVTRNVGIDLGYGFVKATDGEREVVFPSVVGSARELRYRSEFADLSNGVSNLSVALDGRRYFVGDLAIRQSEIASRSLDENRVEDRNIRVLLYTALGLFAQWEQQTFNLVTGLPSIYFGALRDQWSNALRGTAVIRTSSGGEERERTISVDRVRVVPQPLGTLYDRALNNIGNIADSDLGRLRVGVVDIGFKTSDFAAADQMEYIERLSGSTTTGLSNAYALIAERLRNEFRIVKENHEMDQIVQRGELRLAGKLYDISAIRKDAFERVAAKIITELDSLWDYREFDAILITGGGGQALAEYILPRFRNAYLVEGAQLANARGFLKLAANIFRA